MRRGSSLSATVFLIEQEAPEREPPGLTLFPLPRVSFPDGETHQEHEDRHEGSEGDEEDVGRTCRQDPTIRHFQAEANETRELRVTLVPGELGEAELEAKTDFLWRPCRWEDKDCVGVRFQVVSKTLVRLTIPWSGRLLQIPEDIFLRL